MAGVSGDAGDVGAPASVSMLAKATRGSALTGDPVAFGLAAAPAGGCAPPVGLDGVDMVLFYVAEPRHDFGNDGDLFCDADPARHCLTREFIARKP